MDATVLVGAGTALVGAIAGSLGAPLLQGRLADRTSLRSERMTLYAEAMLYTHFVLDALDWAIDPMGGSGTTESATEQRRQLRRVPDGTTARMRLIAHKDARDTWLRLLLAEEALRVALDDDFPELSVSSSWHDGVPADYVPLVRLREACSRFQEACRKGLGVRG